MNKYLKILGILLVLIGIIQTFFVLVSTQVVGQFSFRFLLPTRYAIVGPFIEQFLFWSSVCFLFLLIIVLLILVFFPKKEKRLVLKKNKGEVEITDNAIKKIIKKEAENSHLFERTKIKIKISNRKKRIKCLIVGDAKQIINYPQEGNQLLSDIKQILESMLDVEQENIQLIVQLKGLENKSKARVL